MHAHAALDMFYFIYLGNFWCMSDTKIVPLVLKHLPSEQTFTLFTPYLHLWYRAYYECSINRSRICPVDLVFVLTRSL